MLVFGFGEPRPLFGVRAESTAAERGMESDSPTLATVGLSLGCDMTQRVRVLVESMSRFGFGLDSRKKEANPGMCPSSD